MNPFVGVPKTDTVFGPPLRWLLFLWDFRKVIDQLNFILFYCLYLLPSQTLQIAVYVCFTVL